MKINRGDFVTLKPNSEVCISGTQMTLSKNKVNDGELWAVDDLSDDGEMANINRVLRPYAGAYCSWTETKNLKLAHRR